MVNGVNSDELSTYSLVTFKQSSQSPMSPRLLACIFVLVKMMLSRILLSSVPDAFREQGGLLA